MNSLVITAGRGPIEVHAFVEALGTALAALLRTRGVDVRRTATPPGSVILNLSADAAVADLIGTHELVAAVRGRGARRRWFAGVSLHDVGDPVRALDPLDVAFTATRAGGPGGQHVNTTASAVRATHGPSGMAVRVSGQRSQHRNRREALRRIEAKLAVNAAKGTAETVRARWRCHNRVVRGNAVATWEKVRGGIRRVSSR